MKSDLIKEFEMMEGITVDQFDLKEWHRFERFVLSREKESKTALDILEEQGIDYRDFESDL
jgi:hypothetical protein